MKENILCVCFNIYWPIAVSGLCIVCSLYFWLCIQWIFKAIMLSTLYRYHDGAIATNLNGTEIVMEKMFYPRWWLNATGYFNNHPDFGPDTLLFASHPEGSSSGISHTNAVLMALSGMLCSLCAGMYIGRIYLSQKPNNRDYMVIDNSNL